MIASFKSASERMSSGIWFATVNEVPSFEGVADLLPTNLLRGFFAFEGRLEDFCLDSPVIEMDGFGDDRSQPRGLVASGLGVLLGT